MVRFFSNIGWFNILFVVLLAVVIMIPELGFCDVPVLGKVTSKLKEATESLRKALLAAFGLYVAASGIMAWKAPEMFGNHIFKIIIIGVAVMIAYGASEVVNWFVG
jgi:hypothetical protein